MSNGALPKNSSDHLELLLTITVHNPIAWSQGHLSRSSQHVILASQTLGDLFDVIPCPSNELPEEMLDGDRIVGYDPKRRQSNTGYVLCIEGIAYGDGQSEMDYSEYVYAAYVSSIS